MAVYGELFWVVLLRDVLEQWCTVVPRLPDHYMRTEYIRWLFQLP